MVQPAIDLIGHTSGTHPVSVTGGTSNVSGGEIDTVKISKVVGHEGEQNGGVFKITAGREDLAIKDMGAMINGRMGLNA